MHTPDNPSITLYFPLNEVKPTSLIFNHGKDVYPTKWEFFGSSNGSDWKSLISSVQPTCPTESQFKGQPNTLYCKKIKTEFAFQNSQPFKYLKFVQYANSYGEPCCMHGWNNTFVLSGIDISGIYTVDYFECTYPRFYCSVILSILVSPIILND